MTRSSRTSRERHVEDVVIPLAGKRLLIRMKDTVRHSDRMDVRFLKMRLEDDASDGSEPAE